MKLVSKKKLLIGLPIFLCIVSSVLFFQNFTIKGNSDTTQGTRVIFNQNFNSENKKDDGFIKVIRITKKDSLAPNGRSSDHLQIATRQIPVLHARDSNYRNADNSMLVHTTINDQMASFGLGAVKLAREEWQNNRGFVILKARDNMHGGTYGMMVRSSVKSNMPGARGKAKDTGIHISNNADAMTFFFIDPLDKDATLKPMVLRADGSFAINGRDENTKELKNFLYIRPTGKVGIGTKNPAATLDINGTLRLATQSSEPEKCSKKIVGVIALSSHFTTCVCTGVSWVLSSDGKTACSW